MSTRARSRAGGRARSRRRSRAPSPPATSGTAGRTARKRRAISDGRSPPHRRDAGARPPRSSRRRRGARRRDGGTGSRPRSSTATIACLRAHRAPHRPSALGHGLGRWHDRARLRRRAGDPEARGGGAGDRDARARPALAAARLERDGRRDPLGALAHPSARRLRLRRALDRLRPHADPQVRARGVARRRRADPRLRPRAAAAARAPRRASRRRPRRAGASSGSAGSTSRSRSRCRSSAPSSSPTWTERYENDAARHLALLTRTTEVVNSSLDLQEVMEAIAHEVAAALETDSAYVYLYDERTDELVLRATHGTSVALATKAPRMRRGEGITGAAAADRAPVMIAADAHLDPRFKAFPNLPEDDYASILAVPILAREKLEGALNVRTREPRAFTQAEVDLLMTIAGQVAQSIEHAKLYAQAQRRVHELEALARISEAVSESLYLEESLEAIVQDDGRVDARHRRGDRARGRPHRVARGPGRGACRAAAAALARPHDRRARRRPRHAVLRRRPAAARGDREPGRRRARARPDGAPRRARPGDPPPRQEQPPDGRLVAAPAGARRRTSIRRRRSATRSTGSSRSPRSTRC